MSFDGNVIMPKDTRLPGFPDAITCSIHCLRYKYDWMDEQLQWVRDNWIKIDEDKYARPDSKLVLTEELNSSGEDNKNEPLLKKVLDRKLDRNVDKHPWEELGKDVDKEPPHIPKYNITKGNNVSNSKQNE
jgi:hypothetical protein